MKLQDMTPEQILQKCAYDHGFNDALDKALEMVKQKWTECDFRYGEPNEIRAAMNTAKDIYEAIGALRGGEQE